jgi:CRP/FNR family nitrogen fixation transcriptional regulator
MNNLNTQALAMSRAPPSIGTPRFMLACVTGQPIYTQGDPAHALYAILTGAVRTVRYSRDGRRQVGAFYYPGDLFGLAAEDEHDFTAEAICPTRIMFFERSLTGDDEATVAAALCELSRAHAHLAMLGRRSAEEKVASFLVDMARRGATDLANLPMSRQDMADYLGLALETVSRALGRFKDQGLVRFTSSRDFHIVRGAALNRLAET